MGQLVPEEIDQSLRPVHVDVVIRLLKPMDGGTGQGLGRRRNLCGLDRHPFGISVVGRGGNQSNQVCDDEFDAEAIVAYTWPKDYPLPAKVGTSITDVSALPVVKPVPQDHREVVLPV